MARSLTSLLYRNSGLLRNRTRLLHVGPEIKSELARFDPSIPVESAVTPPSSWFIDPTIYQIERKAVFGRSWICVGRLDQVEQPGQYFTGQVAGEPYIVVRDGSTLRGFFNVCRHHAAQLTDICTQGCTDKFVCPYHGWTYALDGRLTKAMRLRGIKDFKTKEFGLKPIQVAQMGPLIFINLAPDTEKEDLMNKFETAHNSLSSKNYTDMTWMRRVEYPMQCNWKVFVDNYLDGGYHVEYLHPALTENLDIKSYKTTVTDYYSIQEAGGKNNQRVGSSALYIYMYPSLMINKYGPWMDTNMVIPTGVDSCKVVYDYFLSKEFLGSMGKKELDDYIESSLKASDQVQQEDNMICESVQTGLASSAYDTGRYAPGVEMADHAFHQTLAKQLHSFAT